LHTIAEYAHPSLFTTTTASISVVGDMASVLSNASNFSMDNPQFNAIANQTNIHQSLADDSGKSSSWHSPDFFRVYPR
jgi:hypothetical protein